MRESQPSVLAIDLGSSSVRVMAFTGAGEPMNAFTVQQPYSPTFTTDGGVEFDPVALREAVFTCLDQVSAQLNKASLDIMAVGVDTFATNLMGIDAGGQPITPLFMWNDTRSRTYTTIPNIDSAAAHERTGAPFHASYLLPRFRRLRATQLEVFAKAAVWCSIGEWLQMQLFGIRRVSTSLAAWTGLLDRRLGQWDVELLQAADLSIDQLSPISDQPLGKLNDVYARRWLPLQDAIWHPVVADGYAANLGCGAIGSNRAALTIGTSGALRVIVPGVPDRVPPGLFCYKVSAGQTLIGGAVSNAGNVYGWLRETLNIDGDPFDQDTSPGSHGLTVLPYWAGERSPGWQDDAQATICGITLATTPMDVARASLEAVLYQIAAIDQVLCASLETPPDLIAAGGVLAQSPGWGQVTADILGRSVAVCADPQTTARGTALIAIGNINLPAPPISAVYHARPAYTAQHAARRAKQHTLYDLLFKPNRI